MSTDTYTCGRHVRTTPLVPYALNYFEGTSKNRRYFSYAAKLPANDSVSFSFRVMDVHSGAARDRYRDQFFEVPMS